MTDDELKQLLLELLYGLLDDRDAESLRNRIATDAHVAQIFEEVRHTQELLAQAARWKSETSTFQASQTKIGHIAIVDPSFSIPEQLLHSKTSGFSLKSLSFHQDSEKLASPTLKDESDNETGSELFRSAIESPRDEKIYRKNSQKLNDSRLHSKIRKTVSGFKSDSGFPDRASITSNTSKSSVWHQLFPQHQSQNRRRNLNSGSNSGTNLSNKPSIPFKFLLYT
ncbi:MAG: hypothetical protein IKW74_07960, partial [Thermoguttaceae bacterium]|nr:hypothetical protein [Thermoguttaceae bacterium]